MKNEVKEMTFDQRLDKLKQALTASIDHLLEAGRIFVEMIDADPSAKKKVQAALGWSSQTVNQLEAVGRGTLLPQLYYSSNIAHQKLRGLPLSDQKRYLEEPVELVVEKDGAYDTLLVTVTDLTPAQAKQVFDVNHVRAPGAQRAYLEDLKAHAALNHRAEPLDSSYKIHRREGEVEFKAGVRVNASQLLTLLQQLQS